MHLSKAVEGAEKATVFQLFRAPQECRLGPRAWRLRVFNGHSCRLSAQATVMVLSSSSGLLFA